MRQERRDDLVELAGGAVLVAREEHAAERVAEGLHQAQVLGNEGARRRRLHQMQLVQCAATEKESIVGILLLHTATRWRGRERNKDARGPLTCP